MRIRTIVLEVIAIDAKKDLPGNNNDQGSLDVVLVSIESCFSTLIESVHTKDGEHGIGLRQLENERSDRKEYVVIENNTSYKNNKGNDVVDIVVEDIKIKVIANNEGQLHNES